MSENQYGQRLPIHLIEERAQNDDHAIYASIPISTDPKDGFLDVNYLLLKKAIDRCAWFLDRNVGPAVNFETIGWLAGSSDFRYVLLAFAAMKTGHKVFLPSPRNSVDAHLSLLNATECNTFLQPKDGALPIVSVLAQRRSMKLVDVPELNYFLDASTPSPHYPYEKSFIEARYDPCLVLHTSGSTGIPKPIVVKNGWFAILDAYHNLSQVNGGRWALASFENKRLLFLFPMFHAAAAMTNLAITLYWNVSIVHPPNAPLTADLADSLITRTDVKTALIPPSVLKDISLDSQMTENVARLQYLGYGGSPLAPEVGQILGKRTHVVNAIGSTEAVFLPFLAQNKEDWAYLHFRPNSGYEFRPIASNRYEMVLVRDPKLDLFQGVFVTFPELDEFSTKDVFSKHPTKPDFWMYQGRSDDIIVFSNGEKLNPLTLEQKIGNHRAVSGAVVIGSGRFQSCLIVEPKNPVSSASERKSFVESIWPLIDEVNKETVKHGRVDQNLILVTHPNKPLLRTDKGTIRRRVSIQLYEPEVDQTYAAFSDVESTEHSLDFSDHSSTYGSLRSAVSQKLSSDIPSDDADFFSQGLDSVQVISLSRQINNTLGSNLVSPRLIYSNGTIRKLAELISNRGEQGDKPAEKDRETRMEELYQDFAARIPTRQSEALPVQKVNVILTGSTGSIGSYVLDILCKTDTVDHVYCLNRSDDAHERQKTSQLSRGLSTNLPPDRVTFLHTDLSLPLLGLSETQYQNLLDNVTHVIHNAWPVNFNRPVDSFTETHINGVLQFLEFSAKSTYGAHIYFLSTISTTVNWQPPAGTSKRRVPEQTFEDWTVSEHMGYAESKHISERLLTVAASRSNIPTTVCHVGQIAGPVNHGKHGMWNKQEWLPSLVASSATLKVLPNSLGMMDEADWIPVDILGEEIAELVIKSKVGSANAVAVDNLVNPVKTQWSQSLAQVVANKLGNVKLVALDQWVETLTQSEHSYTIKLEANPAIKLLPFYESIKAKGDTAGITLDTTETEKKSAVLRNMRGVSQEWVELWVDQWGF